MSTKLVTFLQWLVLFIGTDLSKAAKILVDFDCSLNGANISYNSSSASFNPTEGRIYVDGYYDNPNCFTDSAPWNLAVTFGTCGVSVRNTFTVIFLHDKDYYLETIDEAQIFRCTSADVHSLYNANSLYNVTSYVPAGEIIPIVGQVAFVPGLNVSVTMILKKTDGGSVIGIDSESVTLGENVTMELHVTHNDKVRIKASHCWAAGIIKNNTWKTLDLVTGGCPGIPFFSGFTEDPIDNHLSANFPMFLITPRHESNRTTGFFCTVTACDMENTDAKCSQSACSGDDPGWGKRRRKRWTRNDNWYVLWDPSMEEVRQPENKKDPENVGLGYFVGVVDESNTLEPDGQLNLSPVVQSVTTTDNDNRFCFNHIAFTAAAVMSTALVIIFGSISTYFLTLLIKNRRQAFKSRNTLTK